MQAFQAALLVLFTSFLVFLWGCGPQEKPQKVDLSKREHLSIAEDKDVVTYAFLPQYSHTVSYERQHLLLEYLRLETGLNFKQVFPSNFDDHIQMVGRGKIDISYTNPVIYIKLAHRFHSSAFAQAVEVYGRERFRGQIITRRDNEAIQTLEDCRGKTWIAVDPGSAGGFIYPLGLFAEHGLTRDDFAVIDFAPGPGGQQEKVVLAVYAGKYDIGSIREGTLNVVADKVDISQIKVVAQSRFYPGWVFSSRHGLDEEIRKKVQEAMVRLDYDNPDHKRILDAADVFGIIAASDEDFDSVRELAEKLEISLDP